MASPKEDSGKIKVSIEELTKDIAERFPHLGVTESDMCTPTSEFVIRVLLAYMNETFHAQIPKQAYADGSCPEAYEGIHLINKLHSFYTLILKSCGFDSLTFSDITQPSPKRTMQIFALTDNCARFYDLKVDESQPLFEMLKNRRETYMSLSSTNKKLRQELEDRAEREARTKELLKEQEARKIEIESLLKELEVARKKDCQIKSEVHTLKQQCENLSQQHHNIDTEIDSLKEQIELVKKLEMRKDQLALIKAEIKEECQKIESGKINLKLLVDVTDGQKRRTQMLRDIIELDAVLKSKKNVLLAKESERKTLMESLKKDHDELVKQQDSVNQLQEQIEQLKLQGNPSTMWKKAVAKLGQKFMDMKTPQGDSLYQALQVLNSIHESEQEIERIIANTLKVDAYIKKKYLELVAEHERFDEEIEQAHLIAIADLEREIKKEEEEK